MAKSSAGQNEGLKLKFVEYLFDGRPASDKGTQEAWARAHKLDPATVSDWKNDDFVLKVMGKVEDRQADSFGLVVAKMMQVAMSDDPDRVAAANFVAKVFGKFKAEKVDLKVGRMGLMEWLGTAQEAPKRN